MAMILAKRKEVVKMEFDTKLKYICKITRAEGKEYLLTVPDFPQIEVRGKNIQDIVQRAEKEVNKQVQEGNVPEPKRLCDLYKLDCCFLYIKVDKPK